MNGKMKKYTKRITAIVLVIVIVFPMMYFAKTTSAKAYKFTIYLGKTKTIMLNDSAKSKKVKWTISNKKVVKVVKKVTRGSGRKKITIKGKKAGKTTITATYKVNNNEKSIKCLFTIKDAKKKTAETTVQQTSQPNIIQNIYYILPTTDPQQTVPVVTEKPTEELTPAPSVSPTAVPTVRPTVKPTATPRPTATPSPVPKNKDGLIAYGKTASTIITADGVATADEWENTEEVDLLKNPYGWRGTKKLTAATASMYWADGEFDVLIKVSKTNVNTSDSVVLYFDEDYKASGSYDYNKNAIAVRVPANGTGAATQNSSAYIVNAAGKTTATGYTVEIKLTGLKVAKEAGGAVSCDIQINDGDATFNYYDSRSDMIYDRTNDKWLLGNEMITVDTNTDLMGPVALKVAKPDPLVAIETKDGSAIRAAAAIASAGSEEYPNARPMTFVPVTYFWNVYSAAGQSAIKFANYNVPEYMGNAEKVSLTSDDVKGYIMWDANYLYTLVDVTDDDIAPTSAEGYNTDSVELFLDEDNSGEATYGENSDAIEIRVNAIDSLFTANENGTANYAVIGYAVSFKKDGKGKTIGYYVEYIVKFTKAHKAGDIMGIDFNINDCFTVPGTDGAPNTPDRAGTVTAFDTTNDAYENPSVFGRVKLKAAPSV